MDKIAGESKKKSSETEKVIVIKHRRHRLIEARVYFPANGEYYPSKKGITLSADGVIELIPLLRDAVAETRLKQEG